MIPTSISLHVLFLVLCNYSPCFSLLLLGCQAVEAETKVGSSVQGMCWGRALFGVWGSSLGVSTAEGTSCPLCDLSVPLCPAHTNGQAQAAWLGFTSALFVLNAARSILFLPSPVKTNTAGPKGLLLLLGSYSPRWSRAMI